MQILDGMDPLSKFMPPPLPVRSPGQLEVSLVLAAGGKMTLSKLLYMLV